LRSSGSSSRSERSIVLFAGGDKQKEKSSMRYGAPTLLVLVLGVCFLGCGGGGTAVEEAPANVEEAPADVGAPPEGGGPPPRWIVAATEMPRGLIRNDAGAAPGYVLFTEFTADKTFLIDRQGRVVHTWHHELTPLSVYLRDNGNLLGLSRIPEPPNFKAGGVAGYLQEFSWDGELLWEWKMADANRMLHHDIEPLENGNVLAIGWELKTPEQARAAGMRSELIPEQGVWSEWILELEPRPPNDARIVWEWRVWDHLVQNYDPDAANYGVISEHPRKLDVNANATAGAVDEEELAQLKALGYVPDDASTEDLRSDFLHMNSIDYHPGLDQIAVSFYEISEIWILDHTTSTDEAKGSSGGRYGHGGDFLYRWGNPSVYGRGDASDQKLFNQHQVQWIPEGMENAGNLTVFNNGTERPDGEYSSVVEWAPPLQADGSYTLPEGSVFGPSDFVWSYVAPERESFFAPFVSGAERLANGNTFVCSGPQGRYFEVTPNGEIVWEYRNPFHGGVEAWMPPGTEAFVYGSFRATKIPPDHPGLANRELSPLDPQPEAYVPPPAAPEGAAPN
jgi:hypothetical protein